MNKQEVEENIAILKSMIPEYEMRNRMFGVKALRSAISALEHQLTNGWIPVSERLPEEPDGRGVWVLTCATSKLVESNHFCNGRFYDADKNGYKIVAWQPLPETYKEENYD